MQQPMCHSKGYRGAHLDPGHLLPQLRGRQGAQPPQPERLREGGARRQSHSQQQVGVKQMTYVLTFIQGDHSACTKPPVHIYVKVAF